MTSAERSEPEELLLQARAGNQAALGRLLRLYEHHLTLLARLQIGRRLQGKVDAADLVSGTFSRRAVLADGLDCALPGAQRRPFS